MTNKLDLSKVKLPSYEEVIAEMDRRACKTSLAEFTKKAWHIIEPATPLVWGEVLDVMCKELEDIFFKPGFQPRLLMNVPPGPGWVENLVTTDKGRKRLGDIQVGDKVLTHKGRYRAVTACYSKGELPTLKITTNSGRRIWATPDHHCLTGRGWQRAEDMMVGDIMAFVTPEEDILEDQMSPEEARLLGYLIGDGSVTQAQTVFTNIDADVLDDFEHCARSIGFETSRHARKSHFLISILGGSVVHKWRQKHGIDRKSSYTKRIPEGVLSSSNEIIRNFIGAYWACDGMLECRQLMSRGSKFRSSATTVSKGLARDLVHALGRIGIRSRLRVHNTKLETKAQPGGIYVSYNIEVQNEADTSRFIDMPGLSQRKNEIAKRCILRRFDSVLNEDEIVSIEDAGLRECMCISVEEDHSLTWDDLVVHNTMKSILVSVMFPAWVWTIAPSKSFTGAAHEQGLAIRDARKMRIIVESDWYQARWPLKLSIDANAKTLFENEKRGFRQAMPFGSLTGRRSSYVLVDDPLSAEHANSEAHLKEAERIFRETLPTRINDDESAIIVIMQRLSQGDTSGLILDHPKKYGYKTLILPMRFEKDRADPKDWRTKEGELLFPERYSLRAVEALEEILGPYGSAGQLAQSPVPREGGMFNLSWFRTLDAMPNDLTLVRGWDLAATTNQTSAYTVGCLMGLSRDGKIVICDVVRGRWTPDGVYRVVNQCAESDGVHVRQSIPLDPGAAGVSVKNQFAKNLAGFDVRFSPESGDKVTRAGPLSAQAEAGNVYLLKGDWNKTFLDEISIFPGSKFKDQVDAATRAYGELLKLTKISKSNVSTFAPMVC